MGNLAGVKRIASDYFVWSGYSCSSVWNYAIWEKVTVVQPKITEAVLIGPNVQFECAVPLTAAETEYEVQVSTSITFRESVTKTYTLNADEYEIFEFDSTVSSEVPAVKEGVTNYIRIRQIKKDSEGNVLPKGKWSSRAAAN